MRRFVGYASIAVVVVALLGAAALFLLPDLRWRAQAVALKLGGKLDGIAISELVPMIVPGSGFYLRDLVQTHNPYSAIENPFTSATDLERGARAFGARCATCHGAGGRGGTGPDLVVAARRRGDTDWATFRSIRDGVPGTAMPAHEAPSLEVWQIVAHLANLRTQHAKAPPSKAAAPVAPVTSQRLANSAAEPDNWLMYSGTFDSQRFSKLDQIDRKNANKVAVKWMRQFTSEHMTHASSPIVNNGVLYVVETPNIVHALDARDGSTLWTHRHRNAQPVSHCCGLVNRGVAVHDNMVFMGTMDNTVVALDAATGAPRWKVKIAEHGRGVSISSAPLIVGDKLIIGVGGGEYGIRGFIDALSVKDGSRLWRFYTVPEPGQPGHETWSGDSWQRGGGGTWLTGSHDPDLKLVYWGVGNPGPDHQGDDRKGDNLHTNSVVALDVDSGKLKWHFQFSPHDERDWASNQIPVLIDAQVDGRQRKLMLWANRNGFFYVFDRATGEFLRGTAFAKQNWATGLDAKGRPLAIQDMIPNTTGRATFPSPMGATNWWSPSYSPRTGLFYVSALEWGQVIYKDTKRAEYVPGNLYLGGGYKPIPGAESFYTSVRAIDPKSGKIVWSRDSAPRTDWWRTGGLVATAGDVVFGGDEANLHILDALNGDLLWKLNVGGRINASPIAFAVDGQQRFALSAGRSIVVVGLP
jgi:alcohol dehydrogenase (cytochrome c)